MFLLATTNKGKVLEIREALGELPHDIKDLSEFDAPPLIPEETGATFSENALLKAQFYFDHFGTPTIADDSGILVDALTDELGIHTRRWGAGADASDSEWIDFFLQRMKREQNKRARFVCSLAYIDSHGTSHIFEGTCEGEITDELKADYLPGLPISACFIPDGCKHVFSALSLEQKNRTSHRGKATLALKKFLMDTEVQASTYI